jgi:phosphoglucosamine mutase
MKFGTDGIRGQVGSAITSELAYRFGWAFAAHRIAYRGSATFAVARDTRSSGEALEASLVAGMMAAGAKVIITGVMPTPALSQFILERGLSGGVMITASHNPAQDNGLKPLNNLGRKLYQKEREGIQSLLQREVVVSDQPGSSYEISDGPIPWLKKIWGEIDLSGGTGSLVGQKIVVDSANGAARFLAGQALSTLGAKVIQICNEGGDQINSNCGSLHPEKMVQTVREHGAIAGIALDGDGDRIQICDGEGRLFDGDDILWLLRGNSKIVVGTIMTNEGLARALKMEDSHLLRVGVGDANVADGMAKYWSPIGGEPSGHILFERGTPTSCGTFTAAKVLSLGPKKWAELTAGVKKTHQITEKVPLQKIDHLDSEIKLLELDGLRVVVRASGTEPVIRLMVEGEDKKRAEDSMSRLLKMVSK